MSLFAMGWSVLVMAFIGLLALVLLTTVFGLPGNWVMLGLVGVYQFLHPGPSGLTVWYWVIVIALGLIGEVLEFGLQIVQARKYGSTGTGTFGGVVGAIVGAVVMAPLFFGIGAFIGALVGAWIGCFLFDLCRGRDTAAAARAAFGCMVGRFLGTVCKLACGAVMLAVTAQYIWPDPSTLPFNFPWLPMPRTAPAIPTLPHPVSPDVQQVMGQVSILFA